MSITQVTQPQVLGLLNQAHFLFSFTKLFFKFSICVPHVHRKYIFLCCKHVGSFISLLYTELPTRNWRIHLFLISCVSCINEALYLVKQCIAALGQSNKKRQLSGLLLTTGGEEKKSKIMSASVLHVGILTLFVTVVGKR